MNEKDSVTCWIELAQSGDAAAQRALWDRFFPQLVRLAERRLRGAPRRMADEEDVVLSVFQSYFRAASENRFPDLRGRDDLWRLLSRMTYRKVVEMLRYDARLKRKGVGESAVPGGCYPDGPGLAQFPHAGPTPLLEVMVADECGRLLGLLKPELQCVALRKLEGYTNQEIARRHACSVATVERRLKLIREIWDAK